MTGVDAWLQAAIADAEKRDLPDLVPLLKALARATETLRTTDFNDPLIDELASHAGHPGRADD